MNPDQAEKVMHEFENEIHVLTAEASAILSMKKSHLHRYTFLNFVFQLWRDHTTDIIPLSDLVKNLNIDVKPYQPVTRLQKLQFD